eukprot:6181630-Pleurochrysis_carterae.AAC.1
MVASLVSVGSLVCGGGAKADSTERCSVEGTCVATNGGRRRVVGVGRSESRRVQGNSSSQGVSDGHIQVRRIGGVGSRAPSVFPTGASNEGDVCAVSASEGGQAAQCRLQAGRAQEGRVFLRARSQCAKRDCDVRTGVTCVKLFAGGHEPDWCMAGVQE